MAEFNFRLPMSDSPPKSPENPKRASFLYAIGWGILLFVLTACILIFSNADLEFIYINF
jgi:hypothetical protein